MNLDASRPFDRFDRRLLDRPRTLTTNQILEFLDQEIGLWWLLRRLEWMGLRIDRTR